MARAEAFRHYFAKAAVRSVNVSRVRVARRTTLSERQLVGLAGRSGRDLALGIVLGWSPKGDRLKLLMPDLQQRLMLIRPGRLWLDETWSKLKNKG